MGCGSSGDPQSRKNSYWYQAKDELTAEEGADLLDTYLRLERDIAKEERAPPAPALGHCMLRLSRFSGGLEAAQLEISSEVEEEAFVPPGSIPDFATALKGENEDEAIKRVMNVLGVNKKPELAMEHEEFIATLNRKGMRETRRRWLEKRKAEAQEEVDRLTERVQHLEALYRHQDSLLKQIERREVSDEATELERLRGYRDTLYSSELSWREAVRLTEAAAALARVAATDWEKAKDIQKTDERWSVGVETRRGIHEAVLCLQSAQAALSSVQFPYCTPREITTILQILEYIFTDMQIPERYNHATQVYNTFYKRAAALHLWLKKMMDETIHKDVMEVDKRFTALATRVINDRVNSIREIVGLGRVKSYKRPRGGIEEVRGVSSSGDSEYFPSSLQDVKDLSHPQPHR